MTELRPIIALGVVVENNQVLLIERNKQEVGDGNAVLSWAFPGGKTEDGESSAQTAVREVKEETGVDVSSCSIIAEGPHPNFPVIVSYIGCRVIGASTDIIMTDPAVARAEWVPLGSLMQRLTSSLNAEVQNYLGLG